MTSRSSPVGPAGRMLITRGLIRLREQAGMTQGQLSAASGISKNTVSKYETWQDRTKLKWSTVRTLAEECGASPAERDALVDLAKRLGDGWWVGRFPPSMDPLLSFEESGEFEHVFANGLVPGLLQTRAYARALNQAQLVRADDDEVERQVEARAQRQDVLDRPNFELWAVLDEAVLRRVVGDSAVMAEQLAHLSTMAARPGIELQVLPFRSGAHAVGAGTHFMIIGRDDEVEPLNSMSVVYLEMHDRGIYLDDSADIASYKRIFDYLRSQAWDTSRSAELLDAAHQEYLHEQR